MTASPVDFCRAIGLVLFVALLGAQPSDAWGQAAPAGSVSAGSEEIGTKRRPRLLMPKPMVPAELVSPQAAPQTRPSLPFAPGRPVLGTGSGKIPAQDPVPSARAPRGRAGIQVDHLSGVNPDSVGALSVAQGGFGPTMWAGAKRPLVDALLPQLPVRTPSPAMRGLIRRLLLSTAVPPDGEGTPGHLIALRIGLLSDMGELEGAAALLGAVPGRARSGELIRLEADGLLLSDEAPKACALAANQIRQSDIPYWQKILIFCQVLAGEQEKAFLGTSLLREMEDPDRAFFNLIEMIAGGGGGEVETLTDPTPLHLVLAKAVQATLPPDMVQGTNPAVLRAMALNVNLPLAQRVLAGERAEAVGALPVLALRDLYGSIPFTEEELANPLTGVAPQEEGEAPSAPEMRAQDKSGDEAGSDSAAIPFDPILRRRALLFHSALKQTVSAAQAEAAAAVLTRSQDDGARAYAAAVRVLLPVLEKLEPSVKLMWLAPDVIRALLSAGRIERAGAWFNLLLANATFNPESATAVALLKPAMRLSGAAEAADWSPRDLALWWEAARALDADEARRRGGVLFSLIEGFGDFVPDSLWAALAQGTAAQPTFMPHVALLQRLEFAGRRGSMGEAVLLSLLFMGEEGPAGAHPLVLRRVVAALTSAGLEEEARALAVEAIGNGAS